MKLRFDVDQAEAFRRGIDCPKSIVTVDVNPAELSQEDRNLIADRLDGIDVCQMWHSDKGCVKEYDNGKPKRVVASEPTFAALMEAIRADSLGAKLGLAPKRG